MTGSEIPESTLAELREAVDRACADENDVYDLKAFVEEFPAEILRPFHRRLIEAKVYYPPELYYGLSEDDASYLVGQINAGVAESWHLLDVLVMAPTSAATRAVAGWRDKAPEWMTDDKLVRETHAGGWELDAAANVRVLTNPVAYKLIDTTDVAASISGGPLSQRCSWCGLPLWRVLDVDLADPAYAGLGLAQAGRVSAATCIKCGSFDPVFHEYDAGGRILVDASDEQSGYFSDPDWKLPDDPALLSADPRPLSPHTGYWSLGGAPDWVQDPAYPACPRCDRTMHHLAQVGREILFGEGYEGSHYVFVDVECRVSTVIFQQT
jgi:hypothetical protein